LAREHGHRAELAGAPRVVCCGMARLCGLIVLCVTNRARRFGKRVRM
jgi:hypothetical protein